MIYLASCQSFRMDNCYDNIMLFILYIVDATTMTQKAFLREFKKCNICHSSTLCRLSHEDVMSVDQNIDI